MLSGNAGHRPVRLTRECNGYLGAQPYFMLAYNVQARGRTTAVRYTPHEARAWAYLTWFLHDVTDAARLVTDPPVSGAMATASLTGPTRAESRWNWCHDVPRVP